MSLFKHALRQVQVGIANGSWLTDPPPAPTKQQIISQAFRNKILAYLEKCPNKKSTTSVIAEKFNRCTTSMRQHLSRMVELEMIEQKKFKRRNRDSEWYVKGFLK